MHETSHVAYEQREYICDRCPDEKRFATKNRLATHVKQVHEGEKVFGSKLCSDCGMIFNSVSSLHAHRYNCICLDFTSFFNFNLFLENDNIWREEKNCLAKNASFHSRRHQLCKGT